MFTLGINLSHHSSLALLKDNEVLFFLHEERLTRIKNYHGLPIKSLEIVTSFTRHIDFVSLISGKIEDLESIIKRLKAIGVSVGEYKCQNKKHHLAHAAAGFYMSNMDEASIIVIDGAGAIDYYRQPNVKISETTSIYHATHPRITPTHKHFVVGYYNPGKRITLTEEENNNFKRQYPGVDVSITNQADIGWKYALVSRKIGFKPMCEGKTMGLSAYGFPGSTDQKAIAAYNVQKELEKYFLEVVLKCRSNNIVLSGGCALNILGNSLIKRTYPHLNVFVDPIAADGTIAIGAAAEHYYAMTQSKDKLVFGTYQGPIYNLERDYIYECVRRYSI